MDAFDFFFPEVSEAAQLRRIADGMNRNQRQNSGNTRRAMSKVKGLEDQIDDLRNQVQFLNAFSMSLLKIMIEKEMTEIGDIAELVKSIDRMDGKEDGGLDSNVLRGLLGIFTAKEEDIEKVDEKVKKKIWRNRKSL